MLNFKGSVFNVHKIGIRSFDNFDTSGSVPNELIAEDIHSNRVLLATDPNTESYSLELPSVAPSEVAQFLTVSDISTGKLGWSRTTDLFIPASSVGPYLYDLIGITGAVQNVSILETSSTTTTQKIEEIEKSAGLILYPSNKTILKTQTFSTALYTVAELLDRTIKLFVKDSTNGSTVSAITLSEDTVEFQKVSRFVFGPFKFEVVAGNGSNGATVGRQLLSLSWLNPSTGQYEPASFITE
jgi:hypothetical protein